MIGIDKLFVKGIKPALLTEKSRDFSYHLLKKDYPYIDMSFKFKNQTGYSNLRCFFQNEESKAEFLKKGMNTERTSEYELPYNEKVMGEFLGFPEAAIQDYMEELTPENRVFVNYHGLCFVVSQVNFKKAVKQLKEKMPISYMDKIRYISYGKAEEQATGKISFF